ncbi:MAG TPA: 1,4-dihydroxy-2-naphthoate octaprenyltransferase [Salinimicrobium sp.]|nr:1,4-dihydroxy-2-naphthoate octaprenyltransferase [Salinimicrobium sp.]
MKKTRAWFSAARLRTLPLSISGILVGSAIAADEGFFEIEIFLLAIITTLGLQILSNFANDYGDFTKGTDNEERVGPMRALQSGKITQAEMLYGIIGTAAITLCFAIALIYVSFNAADFGYAVFFFLLGVASIAAAIKYTVGKSAYGYRGLGDLFVFVFFGIVGVFGSYFLYSKNLNLLVLLPAASIGMLSMAVLNLNNMRDREADAKAGKITLVVKIGLKKAKLYQGFLVRMAIFLTVFYVLYDFEKWTELLFIVAAIPLFLHLNKVSKNENPVLLDPELKVVALSTFLFAVLFGLGQFL